LFQSKFEIILIYFIFVEYTSVRNPLDYCNNIESPPKHKIVFNGIKSFRIYEYSKNIITLADLPSVSQDDIFNIIEQTENSSSVDKGKRRKFD